MQELLTRYGISCRFAQTAMRCCTKTIWLPDGNTRTTCLALGYFFFAAFFFSAHIFFIRLLMAVLAAGDIFFLARFFLEPFGLPSGIGTSLKASIAFLI